LLTKREREVIELRYFDQSDRADTLQSVGDTLSLSRERIRQIECRALQRLRCRR